MRYRRHSTYIPEMLLQSNLANKQYVRIYDFQIIYNIDRYVLVSLVFWLYLKKVAAIFFFLLQIIYTHICQL